MCFAAFLSSPVVLTLLEMCAGGTLSPGVAGPSLHAGSSSAWLAWQGRWCRAREKGASKHTAMSDIHDSVEQLRWYKRHIFRPYKEVRAQQALPAAPQ